MSEGLLNIFFLIYKENGIKQNTAVIKSARQILKNPLSCALLEISLSFLND